MQDSAVEFLNVEQMLLVHQAAMTATGDAPQHARDGALQAIAGAVQHYALYQPEDVVTLGAVLAEKILQHHPFGDGNKRTALLALFTFLDLNGMSLRGDSVTAAHMIEGLITDRAGGRSTLLNWLAQSLVPVGTSRHR